MKKKAKIYWERVVSVNPTVFEKVAAPLTKKHRIGKVEKVV